LLAQVREAAIDLVAVVAGFDDREVHVRAPSCTSVPCRHPSQAECRLSRICGITSTLARPSGADVAGRAVRRPAARRGRGRTAVLAAADHVTGVPRPTSTHGSAMGEADGGAAREGDLQGDAAADPDGDRDADPRGDGEARPSAARRARDIHPRARTPAGWGPTVTIAARRRAGFGSPNADVSPRASPGACRVR
jgi:hypothetical protein